MTREEFVRKYAVERKETNCLKWDLLQERFGDPDLLPMWVADMEFHTCEAITDALKERLDQGVFGYSYIPDSYYQILFDWEERHFGYRPKKEEMRLATGVVPALYWFVNCYTEPGDAVMMLTPVYYPFHSAVTDCKRRLVTCDMDYEAGHFTVDFEKFEKLVKEQQVKLFLLCSPHNPAGRVWKEEELERMFSICEKYDILIVSDEIHQDFTFGVQKHIAALAVAGGKYKDRIVLVNAASKSFNLAALIHSNILIPSPELRKRYDAYRTQHNQTDINLLGLIATEAAYTKGEEWLESLKSVISANYTYVKEELAQHAPEITVCDMEGTYLPMLDLRKVVDIETETKTRKVNFRPVSERLCEFVQDRCRLAVDYGAWFGENFDGFIRLNLATTPENVKQAVDNLIRETRVERAK